MRTRAWSRATAVLVAALFAGGAGGASDLDALLFHGAGASVAAGVAHVETAANPGCHAEQCLLAMAPVNGSAAPTSSVPVRFLGVPVRLDAPAPKTLPRPFSAGLEPPSRAPPPVA